MSLKVAQSRITSAHTAVARILEDYHYGRVTAEQLEIALGQIRNQLDIILDDLGECN